MGRILVPTSLDLFLNISYYRLGEGTNEFYSLKKVLSFRTGCGNDIKNILEVALS
jgi:hypothetical protein